MRTNQTTLCTRCALRFWPTERCPRCRKGRGLVDLRDAEARAQCVRRIRREPWWYRAVPVSGLVYGLGALVVAPVVGLVVGFGVAELGLVALAPWVGVGAATGTWGGFAKLCRKLDAREKASRPVRPFGSPRVQSGLARTIVTGTVRVTPGTPSALSRTRCAAFRIRAHASGIELDDGGGTDFTLELDGGERVAVELDGGASVDLATSVIAVDPFPFGPESVRYFAERGLALGDTPAYWEEAVLCDGERARIEGTLEERPVAEGYRGSRTVRVLREVPGSPLVIRRSS